MEFFHLRLFSKNFSTNSARASASRIFSLSLFRFRVNVSLLDDTVMGQLFRPFVESATASMLQDCFIRFCFIVFIQSLLKR